MSQFNPLNLAHIAALVMIQSEVKFFGTLSNVSQANAEKHGLVPDDYDQFDAVVKNVEALVSLNEQEGDRFGHDTGFLQALSKGREIVAMAAMTEMLVETAAKRGLARVDNEGELRWHEDMGNTESDTYKSLLDEVRTRFLATVSQPNNEDNGTEQQGSQQGSGVADEFRVEEEQEEGRNGAGDVSVSAPRAA